MCAPLTIRLATLEDYPGFLSVAQETHEHHVALLPASFAVWRSRSQKTISPGW